MTGRSHPERRVRTRRFATILVAFTPIAILAGLLFVPLVTASGLLAYRDATETENLAVERQLLADSYAIELLFARGGNQAELDESIQSFYSLGDTLARRLRDQTAAPQDGTAPNPNPDPDSNDWREVALAQLTRSSQAMESLVTAGSQLLLDPAPGETSVDERVQTFRERREGLNDSCAVLVAQLRSEARARLGSMILSNSLIGGFVLLAGLLQAGLLIWLNRLNRALMLARDEAEAGNEAKSRFLAAMSHELRTPLNAIMGYAYLLGQGAERRGDERAQEDLGRVRDAGNHLLSLINDVLEMAKIDADRIRVEPSDGEAEPLIGEIAAMVQPLVDEHRNQLIVNLNQPGPLHTDLRRLRQILYNLLSNASKFTEDGTITIEAAREPALTDQDATARPGAYLVVHVRDTGIGMTDAELGSVFNDFVQADTSSTRRYGGTGLGLSLTRRLSELLGGTVSASSRPGVGSTFTVRIPTRLSLTDRDSVGRDAFVARNKPD